MAAVVRKRLFSSAAGVQQFSFVVIDAPVLVRFPYGHGAVSPPSLNPVETKKKKGEDCWQRLAALLEHFQGMFEKVEQARCGELKILTQLVENCGSEDSKNGWNVTDVTA